MDDTQKAEFARLERARQDARDDLCALVAAHWEVMPVEIRMAWEVANKAAVAQMAVLHQ